MAKPKIIELMPPAELEPRANDVPLTIDQFLKLAFFTRLKQKPNPDKFPGTLALRRFRKGEEICRQGEAGWTAFETLTSADALAVLQEQHAAAPEGEAKRTLEAEIAAVHQRTLAQQGKPADDPSRAVATVYLAVARPQDPKPGLLTRLGRALFPPRRTADRRPLYIPVDGPTDVSYTSRQAPIYEGDLFGEMSCMYGSPRSATIIADCDCYALEMLRNILDKAQKDPGFQKQMDEVYRQRVLHTHLQGLSFFRDLTDAQFAAVRDRLELLRLKDGEVLCREGDPSDCMYVIRSGLVKVVQHLPPHPGPPAILAYRGRGDFVGEMGLVLRQPRNATCIAYVHPEPEDPKQAGVWRREARQVEVVRIPAEVFEELRKVPAVQEQVDRVVAERTKQNRARAAVPPWDEGRALRSARADELGLVQGRRLMLIDLDRCTRCDECVQACVDTHTDGRTRLFLDGPRFGKYLVPTTCRSCLDPVCMIGCPVGAIHRGDNGQIIIEDWCIGCEVCAKNCPYGSIQMHDLGLVPEAGRGWRYYPASLAGADWFAPAYRDGHWLPGKAPFVYDRSLRESLEAVAGGAGATADGAEAVCFRYTLHLDAELARSAPEYRLEVTSTDSAAAVWVNGQEVRTEDKPRRGKREFNLARDAGLLRAGTNIIAVKATPMPGSDAELLALRLDEVRLPAVPAGLMGEFSEKAVTARAVVCDLCSAQWGQRPACVTACPHDAAIRVDAGSLFAGR